MEFRDWLRIQNLSQTALAKDLKLSNSVVSMKIAGKTAWTAADLRILRKKYGLTADFVLGLSEEPYSPDWEGKRWRYV